jgi:hypothetical protein
MIDRRDRPQRQLYNFDKLSKKLKIIQSKGRLDQK